MTAKEMCSGSSRSGGAPSQLTACFVAETLETGELQRFVYDTLQPTYCRRYRKMVEVINKELIPLGVRLPQTDRDVVGGYFIWLTLPESVEGAVLAQRAKEEENVVVAQVSTEDSFDPSPGGGSADNNMNTGRNL
jgi:DNA-binding transcriptional MocR family regulator